MFSLKQRKELPVEINSSHVAQVFHGMTSASVRVSRTVIRETPHLAHLAQVFLRMTYLFPSQK